ncbi:MAG TPA: HAD family phosphatase [Candidatus Acidoferrales bacterium]|nr:HAD family phosphatase [Candidatus Acidoferrales bacterium]
MPSPKIKAVIFDIGRVLIRVDISRALDGLSQSIPLSPDEIWTALQNDPHWLDWQEGRISPRDWHGHLAKRLGGSLSFEQFAEAWNRALDPAPIHPEEFFAGLAKRYRLALLSNTDPIHMSHEEARFPFFRHFPVRIYSYRVGVSKPDPLIYREALRACKVKAEEAVYIDDVPAYAEAASKLGMRGIVYTSPEQLSADLAAAGVLLT